MKDLIQALQKISRIPEKDAADWLSSAESSIEFIKRNVQSERLVLFASMQSVLIHTVLAPLKHLDPPDQKELRHDFITPDASWIIEHASGGGESDKVYLASPMHHLGKTLEGGEKLFFRRSFAGLPSGPIELSQKLVHALGLRFMEDRNAYCRLDENGDLEDVIKVVEESGSNWTENVTVVTILTKDFAEYMRLSEMGMVVFFDFTRTRPGGFSGWTGEKHFNHGARDLFYDGGVMPNHASYVNGRLIVRPVVTLDEIVQARIEKRDPSEREYAIFKAINLRTGKPIEVSCDPKGLSNYFQPESTLPLQLSFAFFRAEVLHKYKADPEKYDLSDRSVSCRGTWSLETFDINDAGQVHSYLIYLSRLPYKEQLYWQSFNEWPKGPISMRALTTDFKGEVYTEYDSLNSLKRKIMQLDESKPSWWQARGEDLIRAVRYPATTSPAEWADEILALDHLLNEGFKLKELRVILLKLDGQPEPEWKSFKLIEECLKRSGVDEGEAKAAVLTLKFLRDSRNVLKGHAAPTKRRELEKKTRSIFGTFRAHFASLAADSDAALGLIIRTMAPSQQI